MFILNSPRLTVQRSKQSNILVVYEYRDVRDEFTISKLEEIKNIIDKYTVNLDESKKIIVKSNFPNIRIICSGCNFKVERMIFINNIDKVYI